MSLFVKFTTEGNEKADELAMGRAMLDGGWMAQTRANSILKERSACSIAKRSQLSLFCGGTKDCEDLKPEPKQKWIFVERSIRKSGVP